MGTGAKEIVDNVSVGKFNAQRSGKYLELDWTMGLDSLKVSSNQAVLLTPCLVNGKDTLVFKSVGVYGRNRYYYYQRNFGDKMMSDGNERSYTSRTKPADVAYHEVIPFAEWMDGAVLGLHRVDKGCCQKLLNKEYGEIGRYHEEFFPPLVYVQPKAYREKRRELKGSAYIDFPVDRTEIFPEYRRNPQQLDTIRHTIEVVRNDADARIDTIWLKGFASPESPYSHNTDLAKGRTEAIRQYLSQHIDLKGVKMMTDFEPEDWAGLKRYVENSNINSKNEIIALIDSDMEPDAKEARIKKLYPAEYKFMLQEYYPALRHTDYKVSYVIRSYHNPEEILAVMRKDPGKLDQNEFYVAASSLEPGSDEFMEVYDTAVRMYPDDEAANLNAANAAIRRDDFDLAKQYLLKAGSSAEADYARAALAIRMQQYKQAQKFLKLAADKGLKQAAVTLEELNKRL